MDWSQLSSHFLNSACVCFKTFCDLILMKTNMFQDAVSTHCGNVTQKDNRNKIVSLKKKQNDASSRDRGTRANGDLYIAGDSQNPGSSSLQNLPIDYDVTRSFDIVMRNVSDARNYFGNLHSHLCTSDLAASVNEQSKCWNGTGVTIRLVYNKTFFISKTPLVLIFVVPHIQLCICCWPIQLPMHSISNPL